MGAIKDAVDLITQLKTSVSDRKILAALVPIEQHVLEAQKENFALQQETSDLQRSRSDEVDTLKAETLELKRQLSELQAKQNAQPDAEFNPKLGVYVESSTGFHYCPSCRHDGKWSPMQTRQHGWQCSCGKFFENPENPSPEILRQQAKPNW